MARGAGSPPITEEAHVEGVADEGLVRWLAEVRGSSEASCRALGAQQVRESARRRVAARPPGPRLPLIRDLSVDGRLPVRLYRPALQPRPMALYLHGGGFVIGDLETHDSLCRHLAEIADVAVLAVDYRRAPEHPGPAAVDDAVTAFGWTRRRLQALGGDPKAGVALAGDSSGAAVALLAGARLRDSGMVPSALFLAYPNADMTLSEPSVELEGHGWGLEADDLRWFVEQWVPDPARRTDPAVSPRHTQLAGLPQTLIATAEHDPLRDEGDALAHRLQAAGVDVHHVRHAGLVHGFLGLGHVSAAAAQAGRDLFHQFGQLLHRS